MAGWDLLRGIISSQPSVRVFALPVVIVPDHVLYLYWHNCNLCRSVCCSMSLSTIWWHQVAAASSRSDIRRNSNHRAAWINDHHATQLLSFCILVYAAADDFSNSQRYNISRVCKPCIISSIWCCRPLRFHKRHTPHRPLGCPWRCMVTQMLSSRRPLM